MTSSSAAARAGRRTLPTSPAKSSVPKAASERTPVKVRVTSAEPIGCWVAAPRPPRNSTAILPIGAGALQIEVAFPLSIGGLIAPGRASPRRSIRASGPGSANRHANTASRRRQCALAIAQIVNGRILQCSPGARSGRFNWSERRDLNSRPPVPQTGALTRLRYAPSQSGTLAGLPKSIRRDWAPCPLSRWM